MASLLLYVHIAALLSIMLVFFLQVLVSTTQIYYVSILSSSLVSTAQMLGLAVHPFIYHGQQQWQWMEDGPARRPKLSTIYCGQSGQIADTDFS